MAGRAGGEFVGSIHDGLLLFLGGVDRGLIPGKVRRVRTACMSAHTSRARDAAASTAGPDPTRSTMSAPCSRTPAAASRSPDLYFCLAYVARSDASLPAGSASSAVAATSGLADADDETRPAWIQRAPLPPRRRPPRGDSTRRRSALASMVCASRTVRRACCKMGKFINKIQTDSRSLRSQSGPVHLHVRRPPPTYRAPIDPPRAHRAAHQMPALLVHHRAT